MAHFLKRSGVHTTEHTKMSFLETCNLEKLFTVVSLFPVRVSEFRLTRAYSIHMTLNLLFLTYGVSGILLR